jgi:hypothetical protein
MSDEPTARTTPYPYQPASRKKQSRQLVFNYVIVGGIEIAGVIFAQIFIARWLAGSLSTVSCSNAPKDRRINNGSQLRLSGARVAQTPKNTQLHLPKRGANDIKLRTIVSDEVDARRGKVLGCG